MRKVLVTGASGFVGGHIVDALLEEDGFEVHILARRTSDLGHLRDQPIRCHYGDLLDPISLRTALEGIDTVIHSAAKIKAKNYDEFREYNVRGTCNLLQAAIDAGRCRSFILVSTQAAASPSRDGLCVSEEHHALPISDYGRSKLESERVALSHQREIRVIVLRPVAVYGPRDRETLKYIRLVNAGIALKPGLKTTRVSLIYVKDLAAICPKLLCDGFRSGSVYYLSDGVTHDLKEVLKTISQTLNRNFVYLPVPSWVALFFCAMNDALHLLPVSAELVSLDKIREMTQSWVCSIDKARKELGFTPRYSLSLGMQETIDWYRRNNWL